MRRETERQGRDKIKDHSWKERNRESQTDRQGRTDKKRGDRDRQANFWDKEATDQRLGLDLRTQKPGA